MDRSAIREDRMNQQSRVAEGHHHNRGGALPQAAEPLKILLAESAGATRQRMQQVLKGHHYHVTCVADGFEVLCRLPELRPDILMMSFALPRLSGAQVCTLLRQSPDFSDLRIVLLSEQPNFLDSVNAERVAADGCLPKPFRSSELSAVLSGLAARAEAAEL
jgi:twitching motility two-component system response regulator PilG